MTTPTPTHIEPFRIGTMGGTVQKDAHNRQGNYRYASGDAVHVHIRDALSKAGLAVWQQQTHFELVQLPTSPSNQNKLVAWIQATYELALAPVGQKPEHVEQVTVIARFLDAQSTGAVRSYARKYWLLGKFSLATGDLDTDSGLPSDTQPDPTPQTAAGRAAAEIRAVPDMFPVSDEQGDPVASDGPQDDQDDTPTIQSEGTQADAASAWTQLTDSQRSAAYGFMWKAFKKKSVKDLDPTQAAQLLANL